MALISPYLQEALYALGTQLNPFQAVVVTVMASLAPQMIINLRRASCQYTPGIGAGTAIIPGDVNYQSQNLS